jgi:hypothetical protein
MKTQFKLLAAFLSLILASPARAYDYPLSPSAIRELIFWEPDKGALGLIFWRGTVIEFPNSTREPVRRE